MTNIEIAILVLLILIFLALVAMNIYFKLVCDYFESTKECYNIIRQMLDNCTEMVENVDKRCDILGDAYVDLWKMMSEQKGSGMDEL